MGDIGMIKGGLLAWLLCRQIRILDGEVVDHRINIGLRIYRKEVMEGETINNTANRCNTNAMAWQDVWMTCSNALLSILDGAGKYSGVFSQL